VSRGILVNVLSTQWQWSRLLLVPAVVVAFTMPVLSVQPFNDAAASGFVVREMLDRMSRWAPVYPLLSAALGVLLATTAWSADHRGRHVYQLSLPIPRWKFVLYRLAAGLVLLTFPIGALWFGAMIAGAAAEIPPSLEVHAHALAGRFLLASLLSYSVFFAITSGTTRTAGIVLGLAVVLALVQLLLRLFGSPIDLVGPILDAVIQWPGPLAVFGGRWMLIDL
jgi:hypothetical protein